MSATPLRDRIKDLLVPLVKPLPGFIRDPLRGIWRRAHGLAPLAADAAAAAPPAAPDDPELERLCALFTAHGGSDLGYFRHHYPRFRTTRDLFLATWDRTRGTVLLDLGAHWLHQSVMWAEAGFTVHAMDLPVTLEMPAVRSVAAAHGIRLLPNANLEQPTALAQLPDDSVDVILFAEIIEHLTFNTVAMWREIYRVLKPRGRIIVTTPNYYALRGRVWSPRRFLSGMGGGLNVQEMLELRTHGHHWKEFSLREVIYHFVLLSPDFNCVKALHLEDYRQDPVYGWRRRLARAVEKRVPILRPYLHVEIELDRKAAGIGIEPHW